MSPAPDNPAVSTPDANAVPGAVLAANTVPGANDGSVPASPASTDSSADPDESVEVVEIAPDKPAKAPSAPYVDVFSQSCDIGAYADAVPEDIEMEGGDPVPPSTDTFDPNITSMPPPLAFSSPARNSKRPDLSKPGSWAEEVNDAEARKDKAERKRDKQSKQKEKRDLQQAENAESQSKGKPPKTPYGLCGGKHWSKDCKADKVTVKAQRKSLAAEGPNKSFKEKSKASPEENNRTPRSPMARNTPVPHPRLKRPHPNSRRDG